MRHPLEGQRGLAQWERGLPGSRDSKHKALWNQGAQQETSGSQLLELLAASFSDDSWALQDLEDRAALSTHYGKDTKSNTSWSKTLF